jgi:hypothetical protein
MLYNSLTQSLLFVLCPSPKFKKIHNISEAGSASVFREEAPNLVDPLDRAVLSHWVFFFLISAMDKVHNKGIMLKCISVYFRCYVF